MLSFQPGSKLFLAKLEFGMPKTWNRVIPVWNDITLDLNEFAPDWNGIQYEIWNTL